MSENFCNWTDANAFMRACFDFAALPSAEQRAVIVTANKLESPLEVVMLAAITVADKFIKYQAGAGAETIALARQHNVCTLAVSPAVPIGSYRADLVMTAKFTGLDMPVAPVVVECDGFTYHDKTRDQAIRDRQRDRYMQRLGYVVARFSGDEIVERPFECAFEVYDLVLRQIATVDRDAHPAGGWPVFNRRTGGQDSGPMSVRMFDLQHDSQPLGGEGA